MSSLPESFRPTDSELRVIRKGYFLPPELVFYQWINWAIEYTNSNHPKVHGGSRPSLVEMDNLYSILQKAANKYLNSLEESVE